MMDIKRNNIDLLRLLAALQVMFTHTMNHLHVDSIILKLLYNVLSFFPGVQIFFIISGFLITASYERNYNIKQYAFNRFLRIYPALWVAFFISVLIISALNYCHSSDLKDFIIWTFCQITCFQFYNPSFLRAFGVGVLNGSFR
jgi:peptidoglycan/LPS O-acetylase OafA/YrhL